MVRVNGKGDSMHPTSAQKTSGGGKFKKSLSVGIYYLVFGVCAYLFQLGAQALLLPPWMYSLSREIEGSLPALEAAFNIGYPVPAVIAFARSHHNHLPIAALTFLAGWTIVGWVAAFVWALTATQKGQGVKNA